MNSLFDWQQWGEPAASIISTSAHIIGFFGMMCVVLAFWLIVSEKWQPTSLKYNLLNGCGAILLILSLCVHFNLGSFVIEIFWIAISIKGIRKSLKAKQHAN